MREDTVEMKLRWQDAFAALKHYNYRLWFFGQMVSLAGTWMQSTALGYLVYQLTGSPAYLGLVGFAAGLPSWLFMLVGGVAADRIARRTLLVVTQVFMMFLAFVLAALTFTGVVRPWHIIALAFLLGVANAFDAPARVSFITELVSREDMTNGIALNATMFNIGAVAGPALAGLAYAALGPGWCFALNGASFTAIIAGLLLMRLRPATRTTQAKSIWGELAAGLRFVRSNRLVLALIGSVGLVGVFAMGMMTLLPAWAVEVLGGDVTTNGYLVSARGLGALASALMLALLGKWKVRGKLWTIGSFLLPTMLFAFAWTRRLPLSLGVLAAVGWSHMVMMNSSNAMVQSQVPDELRGRVMSVFTLVFFGSMPLGSLLAGAAAETFSEPPTVMLAAGALLACALVAWLFLPAIRRQE